MDNRQGFTLSELIFAAALLVFGVGFLALIAAAVKWLWTH